MSRIIVSWTGPVPAGSEGSRKIVDAQGTRWVGRHEGRVLEFCTLSTPSEFFAVCLDEKSKAISARELTTIKFEREEPDAQEFKSSTFRDA